MAEADINSEAQSESMPVLKSERIYDSKTIQWLSLVLRARHGASSREEL